MTASELTIDEWPSTLQTIDEFEAWEAQHPHEGSYEFVRGQIVKKESMKQAEFFIVQFLTRLFTSTQAYKQLDELLTESDSYIDSNRKRVPDLAYFTQSQLQNTRAGKRVATLFSIELLSASETYESVNEKINDYFDAGAQLVWYIAPKQQRIYSYTSPENRQTYQGSQIISAAPVLPDFEFAVADLFRE